MFWAYRFLIFLSVALSVTAGPVRFGTNAKLHFKRVGVPFFNVSTSAATPSTFSTPPPTLSKFSSVTTDASASKAGQNAIVPLSSVVSSSVKSAVTFVDLDGNPVVTQTASTIGITSLVPATTSSSSASTSESPKSSGPLSTTSTQSSSDTSSQTPASEISPSISSSSSDALATPLPSVSSASIPSSSALSVNGTSRSFSREFTLSPSPLIDPTSGTPPGPISTPPIPTTPIPTPSLDPPSASPTVNFPPLSTAPDTTTPIPDPTLVSSSSVLLSTPNITPPAASQPPLQDQSPELTTSSTIIVIVTPPGSDPQGKNTATDPVGTTSIGLSDSPTPSPPAVTDTPSAGGETPGPGDGEPAQNDPEPTSDPLTLTDITNIINTVTIPTKSLGSGPAPTSSATNEDSVPAAPGITIVPMPSPGGETGGEKTVTVTETETKTTTVTTTLR
ncbi:MAG: hypothetical protein M1825_001461 [Sarcosagium campestre]|nr:MAG: hypothetical protein M1825_001461 [Sarcosagium campestre]